MPFELWACSCLRTGGEVYYTENVSSPPLLPPDIQVQDLFGTVSMPTSNFSCIYLWSFPSDLYSMLPLTLLPGREDSLSSSFGRQSKGQHDEALWWSGTHSVGTGAQLSDYNLEYGLKGLVCRLTVIVISWSACLLQVFFCFPMDKSCLRENLCFFF